MKKIVIVLIVIFIIIFSVIFIMLSPDEKRNTSSKRQVVCTTESFTIGDAGTEVHVKIKNKSEEEIVVKKIKIILYDDQNEKIGNIIHEQNIKLKNSNEKIILAKDKEKYLSTNKIEYKVE